MNISSFRSQLEEELTWRTEEILFFQNQCASVLGSEQQQKFRRALVLLLYSNFEGFCTFALQLYVAAINEEEIECSMASYAIVAASLHDVLATLRTGNKKAPEFKNSSPNDPKLHLFSRDREFVERAYDILKRKVRIPDGTVNTESNLNSVVLRKNLYRLGLPHEQFQSLEPEIERLLGLRNRIAHGESKQGVSETQYEQLRRSALHVMSEITASMTKAFSEKKYLLPV
jgi:RiboL-PSP-HEPN